MPHIRAGGQEAKQREASKRRMEQASRSGRRSFSGPPKSLHLAAQLSENRRRRQRVTDRSQYEHERELHHLRYASSTASRGRRRRGGGRAR